MELKKGFNPIAGSKKKRQQFPTDRKEGMGTGVVPHKHEESSEVGIAEPDPKLNQLQS